MDVRTVAIVAWCMLGAATLLTVRSAPRAAVAVWALGVAGVAIGAAGVSGALSGARLSTLWSGAYAPLALGALAALLAAGVGNVLAWRCAWWQRVPVTLLLAAPLTALGLLDVGTVLRERDAAHARAAARAQALAAQQSSDRHAGYAAPFGAPPTLSVDGAAPGSPLAYPRVSPDLGVDASRAPDVRVRACVEVPALLAGGDLTLRAQMHVHGDAGAPVEVTLSPDVLGSVPASGSVAEVRCGEIAWTVTGTPDITLSGVTVARAGQAWGYPDTLRAP